MVWAYALLLLQQGALRLVLPQQQFLWVVRLSDRAVISEQS